MSTPNAETWKKIKDKLNLGFDPKLAFLVRVGSHAHGTHLEAQDPTSTDDTDYVAIITPPPEYVFGFQRFEATQFWIGSDDINVYAWPHYMRMMLKSNPNVLGSLWLHEDDVYVENAQPYWMLLQNRADFATKAANKAFKGYAADQMKKMVRATDGKTGHLGEKRKLVCERFGHDVRMASHTIRLLRMNSEFLVDGVMRVRRDDAAELIAIKRGEWSLEQVRTEVERLFELCREREAVSPLPEAPDPKRIEMMMMEELWRAWGRAYRK